MTRLKSAALGIVIIVGTILTVQLATAQSVDEWRKAAETGQPKFKLIQEYHGTTPGTGNSLPKVEELKGKNGSWITWPGFMMKSDGTSRLFLQATAPLEYNEVKRKKKITLTFKDTKVFLSNNQNPLVTLHFNTPLRRAYLKKSKKKAELVLELKVDTEFEIMQVSIEDGYSYIFIDFPAGQFPTGGEYGSKRPTYSGSGDAESGGQVEQAPAQVEDDESPF